MTDEINKRLIDRLQSTNSVRERVLMLGALSNVGDYRNTHGAILPFFKSKNERVRIAAFDSFRRMVGEESFKTFSSLYADEPSIVVRRRAVRTAFNMAKSNSRNLWAMSLLEQERDVNILQRVVLILGDGIEKYPKNYSLLQNSLEGMRDREVRKAIFKYVSPVRKEVLR